MVDLKQVGAIDTMLGFPHPDMKEVYRFITRQTKDTQSKEEFDFPVEYMFKDVPEKALESSTDPVGVTLAGDGPVGDRQGTDRRGRPGGHRRGRHEAVPGPVHPLVDRRPQRRDEGDSASGPRSTRPSGCGPWACSRPERSPRWPINDKKMYPLYAKCVELGIPIFCCAGIPGPRLKAACQHVELIDEVMFDFPDLVFVTRHGCEPWTDLAVKLMLKWPGLHYSTSAFAPKYYPKDIVDYANTRGADKIIYAGYFPMGLSFERIMTEMPNVGFKDEVWPKFLRTNALRVLGLQDG